MSAMPITNLLDDAFYSLPQLPMMMAELVDNGSPYLTLTSGMLGSVMQKYQNKLDIQQYLKDTGAVFLDAHAGFGPYVDLNCPVPELRNEVILRHKLQLSIAADFGVKYMAIHIGNGVLPGYSMEDYRRATRDSLEALLPEAERLGIIICIENIWYRTNTPEELLGYIEYFNSPWLGLCYDAGHANMISRKNASKLEKCTAIDDWAPFGVEPPWDDDILEKMLPHIVMTHLHDNCAVIDEHLIPGDGQIDWPYVMKQLAKAPRLQVIGNECIVPRKAVSSIRRMCRVFNGLVDMMHD